MELAMAVMGFGYGSEFHLLRYFGRHRTLLDDRVSEAVGAEAVSWLDQEFDLSDRGLDRELRGLDFLNPEHPARKEWAKAWPQRGNPPNWDAVGRIRRKGLDEWLLV